MSKNITPHREIKKIMKLVYISEENHRKLKVKSSENGLQLNQVVNKIVKSWLNSNDESGVIDSCIEDKKSGISGL